jgi:hypothetical protein
MPVLHLEPEALYACAAQISAQSSDLQQQAKLLVVVARSMDWYGPNRDQFSYHLEKLARHLERMGEDGLILAERARREAEEWQALDAHFGVQFSQLNIPKIRKG